jgi:hypothetical protein
MPILMLGLVALAVFIAIGVMLFGATIAENRDRHKDVAKAAAKLPEQQVPETPELERPKANAVHV